jgi:sensor c-di-GMP phosphodiesterase-like protein
MEFVTAAMPVSLLAPIVVHYQPIVGLVTQRMVGCEALSRWHTASGELCGPGAFVASIENDLDLAVDLTSQVFHSVSSALGPFLAATRQFYVSINVPPVLVANERRLGEMLEASNLLPFVSRIVFEITERQALDERGREAIRRGRKLGGRVALDDFGTGQSGFRDLIGLEVDFIKLDHSYIEPLNRDPLTERLVRAFAAFAAVLHVDLVAEGVETPEQAAFLRAVGVEKGQGFLWSRALSAEELIARYQSEHASDDVPQTVDATPP